MMSTIERRALQWLLGQDTGASSHCLCATMLDLPARDNSWPRDGGDLGRCLRLLDLIPEWKPRLAEMRPHCAQWSSLIDIWPRLEALFREEMGGGLSGPYAYKPSPRTYELIKAATAFHSEAAA